MRELRELRERLDNQEQLLKSILTLLELSSKQHSPGWMPSSGGESCATCAGPACPGWMPSNGSGGVTESIRASGKIRKVDSLQTNPRDIVVRLRLSWLGQFYKRHLKQYAVIRWIAYWIWRNGYPVYVNHIATRLINRKAMQWLPLIKLSEFTEKSGVQAYKLLDAAIIETPKPKVFPTCDQDYLVSPNGQFRFPEIYVAIVNNAITYGGTNLILTDNGVVYHDLYDFDRDYTSEELHGRTLIDPKSKRIRWLLHDEAPAAIPVAATFVDACASNYAHWMTEVLPRVVLFCAEDRFLGVPIVVNDGLHPNIMESLFLVTGADREIITLPIGRALAVAELYLTSVTGYVPFERRTNMLSGHSHGLFSARALESLRNRFVGFGETVDLAAWPEKIYLRRNSGTRKVTNASEVEERLLAKGYVIVDPEKLTFLQQVQLFNHAKEIVSPTGAALANAIACNPDAKIAILMSKHKDMIYGYWNNMLSPFGIKVNYVLGTIIENHDLGIHGDFVVDINCIDELLVSFEEK